MDFAYILIEGAQLWAIMKREDGKVICRPGTQEALAQTGWDNKCGHCHIMKAFPESVIEGMDIVLPKGVTVEVALKGMTDSFNEYLIEYTDL